MVELTTTDGSKKHHYPDWFWQLPTTTQSKENGAWVVKALYGDGAVYTYLYPVKSTSAGVTQKTLDEKLAQRDGQISDLLVKHETQKNEISALQSKDLQYKNLLDGLRTDVDGKENQFAKKSGFNRAFGEVANTVLEGSIFTAEKTAVSNKFSEVNQKLATIQTEISGNKDLEKWR